MARKKIIVVLGMHRSGTSVIARGLQVMGVALGDRLMPAHREVNPKGFWEDLDFNALDIEMMDALGSEWHYLSPVSRQDVEILRRKGFYARAVELLRAKVGNSPVFGIKDPRITRLLPFWKEVLDHSGLDVRYVLSLRNPMSVAKSLAKRDGLDFDKSYLLWLGHVLGSLAESQGAKRVLVDYDLLISAPDVELKKIAAVLELPLDSAELEKYQSEFLDETLRHGNYKLEDLRRSEEAPALAREVFEVLQDAAQGKVNIDALPFMKQVEVWLQRLGEMRAAMKLVDRYCAQSHVLNGVLSERESQVAHFKQVLADLTAQIEDERHGAGAEIARLNQVVTEREEQVAHFNRTMVDLTALIEEERRGAGAEIARLNQVVSERDGQIKELTDETVRRGQWALGLDKQLQEVQLQLNRVVSSNSWKVTRPLREVMLWQTNSKKQFRRNLGGLLRLAKRCYSELPFGQKTRAKHRHFIAKYSPRLLHLANAPAFIAPPPECPVCRPEYDPNTYCGGINLKTSPEPVVSVIIPVYGQCDYTLRCLTSIADKPPATAFEVIVVNDCSPDNSAEVLQQVGGIRLISNDKNQGFIRSCNVGAQAAKGRYVCFLNNDTEVMHGWLDELVRTFDTFPGTGLAGSKLIYPDGSLQEAGGIIWQDGSAWNFGRNQDPSLPIYNYAREVDYCSGASIVVPKTLFDDLGGFDEHYLPAYCEDADLALKIRDKGYRVIYQPLSTVVHYEGATSGTDITQGVKAYQAENSKKLFVRWQERLLSHQPNGENVDNAKDRCATRRVLVIDHCTPTPNQDSGSIDTYNIMLLLREMGFQVTFIPEDNFLYMPEYTTALQHAGIEVLYALHVTSVEQHLKDCGHRYDLAFLFRPKVVERHLKTIRKYCSKAKVLYHTVDLHYLRMSREADLFGDAKMQHKASQMKQRELELIREVDVTTVISTKELDELSRELPLENIKLLPFSRHVRGTNKSFEERRDVVFVGGYQHTPNVDAVQYFIAEIMPLLRQRLPGVCFHVVGSQAPDAVLSLAAPDIVIHGFVEDIDPLLDQMRINVAPLRYGAGIKGKVGAAMAVGLPSVVTPMAMEGMSLTDGVNILVADGADAFAETIAKLYEDEILWSAISRAGLEFADKTWGAEAAWKTLANIMDEIEIKVVRGVRPLKLYSPEYG